MNIFSIIKNMFQKLRTIWKNYGYEITIGAVILLILVFAFFRRGQKGTWSSSYVLPGSVAKRPRAIPKESKGEIECRRVVEEIFKRRFPKVRPSFLENPVTSTEQDVNNLEIDCYNDELKIGIEYNGIQHYRYIPYFHRTRDAFHNQKYRDYIKRDLCKRHGILLIEVPYTVKIPEIKSFILNKLSSNNKWTPMRTL